MDKNIPGRRPWNAHARPHLFMARAERRNSATNPRLMIVSVKRLAFAIAAAIHVTPLFAQTPARAAPFDRLDKTARAAMATVRCAKKVGEARANGVFGPIDSLGRSGMCFSNNAGVFGAFVTADSSYTNATRLSVVDLNKGTKFEGRVDTAAILAQSRATRDGLTRGFPDFTRDNRQFLPVTFRSAGDSIEVWLLPATLFMGTMPGSTGGDRAFIYSPDGKTLAREINATDRYQVLTIPDSGQISIPSRENDLPLVSEMIAADRIHFQKREVQIVTKTYSSSLTGPEGSEIWVHSKR